MKALSPVCGPKSAIAKQSADGARSGVGGVDTRVIDAMLHDDRVLHPVVLNTSLHYHLAATGTIKASTLASSMRALEQIRHQKRIGSHAKKEQAGGKS